MMILLNELAFIQQNRQLKELKCKFIFSLLLIPDLWKIGPKPLAIALIFLRSS